MKKHNLQVFSLCSNFSSLLHSEEDEKHMMEQKYNQSEVGGEESIKVGPYLIIIYAKKEHFKKIFFL